jgi:hypothetical protein
MQRKGGPECGGTKELDRAAAGGAPRRSHDHPLPRVRPRAIARRIDFGRLSCSRRCGAISVSWAGRDRAPNPFPQLHASPTWSAPSRSARSGATRRAALRRSLIDREEDRTCERCLWGCCEGRGLPSAPAPGRTTDPSSGVANEVIDDRAALADVSTCPRGAGRSRTCLEFTQHPSDEWVRARPPHRLDRPVEDCGHLLDALARGEIPQSSSLVLCEWHRHDATPLGRIEYGRVDHSSATARLWPDHEEQAFLPKRARPRSAARSAGSTRRRARSTPAPGVSTSITP